MAALPFALLLRAGGSWCSSLVRLARALRVVRASLGSDVCAGLLSGGAVFLLRVEAGGGCDEGAGAEGGLGDGWLAEPAERLAAERVTLDDMRFWMANVCLNT